MGQIGGLRGKGQFDIGGEVDLARAAACIGEGDAPRLGIVFGRDDDFSGGREGARAAGQGGLMFAEDGCMLAGACAPWLCPGGPAFPGLHVVQIDKRSQRIDGRIGPPAGNGQIAPAAVARASGREHDAVAPVRQQVSGRGGRLGRVEAAQLGGISRIGGGDAYLGGAGAGGGHIARHAFLQQQVNRLHHGHGMKAGAQAAGLNGIGDGGDRHALMMGHEAAHDHGALALRYAFGGEIHRFIKAVAAFGPKRGQTGKVCHGSGGVDHGGKAGGIGGDDAVLAQPALEPQPRHAKVGVLIGHLQIAGVVGGFRYAPWNAQGAAMVLLAGDDQRVGLGKNRSVRRTHHQRGHQIFEHRPRP